MKITLGKSEALLEQAFEKIKSDHFFILEIENPTEEMISFVVKENPFFAGHLVRNNVFVPKELILEAFTKEGLLINLIEDATTEQKMDAIIRTRGLAIKNITNPSRDLIILALEQSGVNIEYIKEPDQELLEIAINNSPEAISHIKNPPESIICLALSKQGELIRFIPKPSKQAQLVAVTEYPTALKYIKSPNKETIRRAFSITPYTIIYAKNASLSLKKEALTLDPYMIIKYKRYFSIELQDYAFDLIKKIKEERENVVITEQPPPIVEQELPEHIKQAIKELGLTINY